MIQYPFHRPAGKLIGLVVGVWCYKENMSHGAKTTFFYMKHGRHFPFVSLPEFDFIQNLSQRLDSSRLPEHWQGIGDDCARVGDWWISTDVSVEGTHFRLDWCSIEQAVIKAVLSNFSDLNAMGARTEVMFWGLVLPKHWSASQRDELIQAVQSVLRPYGVLLLGGDTTSGDRLTLAITVMGRMLPGGTPLYRSGAQVGQKVYVTGPLGFSAAGLYSLQQGWHSQDWAQEMIAAYHLPSPPLDTGPLLVAKHLATAAIDVSDGLSSELWHLANSSGVQIQIERDQLPVSPSLQTWAQQAQQDPLSYVLHGGEDYQMVFCSEKNRSLLALELQNPWVAEIGRVLDGNGVTIMNKGCATEMEKESWSHL